MNRRTVKSTGKSTSANLSKTARGKSAVKNAAPLDHRDGSKALKAHRYVRQHLRSPASEVIKGLKKIGLTEGTARNWRHVFSKHPIGKVTQPKAD